MNSDERLLRMIGKVADRFTENQTLVFTGIAFAAVLFIKMML